MEEIEFNQELFWLMVLIYIWWVVLIGSIVMELAS